MRIAPLAVFSAISLASAQMPMAVVQPHVSAVSGRKVSSAAAPVLGYVLGPGATQLRPILATSALARLGDPLAAPSDSKRLYLPPRQQYSLVELNTGSSLGVWDFQSEDAVLLSNVMAHPDLVSFSPRGEAVVLYAQGSGSLQVVRHLPAQAVVSQVSLAGLGMLVKAAISDDGELLVAELADGGVFASWKGGTWNILPWGATTAAWSFVPKSHNLAISDGANQIVLLTNSQGVWANPRILARNVQADELAASVSGNELVATSRSDGKIWTIALESGELTAMPDVAKDGMLSCLRDGFTFVVSISPGLSLLNVRSEAAGSTAGAFRE